MSKQLTEPRSDDAIEQYNGYPLSIIDSLDTPTEQDIGCRLGADECNEYPDVFSGINVTDVGHNDETAVETIKNRLYEFVHRRSNVHPGEPITELGQRLADRPTGDLAAVVVESVLITSSITIPSEKWIQPPLIIDSARFTRTADSLNGAPTEVTA